MMMVMALVVPLLALFAMAASKMHNQTAMDVEHFVVLLVAVMATQSLFVAVVVATARARFIPIVVLAVMVAAMGTYRFHTLDVAMKAAREREAVARKVREDIRDRVRLAMMVVMAVVALVNLMAELKRSMQNWRRAMGAQNANDGGGDGVDVLEDFAPHFPQPPGETRRRYNARGGDWKSGRRAKGHMWRWMNGL